MARFNRVGLNLILLWFTAVILISLGSSPARALTSIEVQALPNRLCVNFTVLGACQCAGFIPGCVQVGYWEPASIVETVKVTGKTNISLAAQVVSTILTAAGVAVGVDLGGGGAANTGEPGQTNLHFNEAHVFPFPELVSGPCDGCVPQVHESLIVNYVSELDPLWRIQPGIDVLADPLGYIGLGALGVWARLYPRVGFAIHGSEPVGSAIAASRAQHIATVPVDAVPTSPADSALRPVLTPSTVLPTCIQLARPIPTFCFPVGLIPALWETGTVSPLGEYIWIFWRYRTCCIDPATTLCGIVQGSGAGLNFCPPIPTGP